MFGRDLGARRVAALWAAGSFATATAIGGVGLTMVAAATGPAGGIGGVAHRHRAARSCLVPGYGKPLNHLWRPDMTAAVAYARSRVGDIAFAVRTDHRFYGYRANHVDGRPAWSRRC